MSFSLCSIKYFIYASYMSFSLCSIKYFIYASYLSFSLCFIKYFIYASYMPFSLCSIKYFYQSVHLFVHVRPLPPLVLRGKKSKFESFMLWDEKWIPFHFYFFFSNSPASNFHQFWSFFDRLCNSSTTFIGKFWQKCAIRGIFFFIFVFSTVIKCSLWT